ncbi:MAG: hypothetical protein EA402_08175 [Planctomycetota bacterium]|nr:MAG: hypothetical protein EA402_08175 [Planctomycetota bacterium]
MLTLVIRVCFVVLCTASAGAYGRNYFEDTGFPVWLAGAIGFAVAVTLIAIEQAFRKRFARAVMTVTVGLFGGLLLSTMILNALDLAIQNPAIRDNIDIPIILITTYLAIVTVLHHADRFRIIVPFVEFRSQSPEEGSVVLELSALADSRLPFLAQAGLFGHRLLVHEQTVKRCQDLVASEDEAEVARGQRALSSLAQIKDLGNPILQIESTELPRGTTGGMVALELARLEGSRLCSADPSTIARAKTENIGVVDLAILAEVLSAGVQPGDSIKVRIERAGEHKGQGVGHHRDGSLVIVSDCEQHIGQEIQALVKRLHHTAQGRMIFAEPHPGTREFRRRTDRITTAPN